MYVYNIGKIMMLFTNILLDVGKIIVTDFVFHKLVFHKLVFHKLVFHKLVFRDVMAYARYLFLGWDMLTQFSNVLAGKYAVALWD